MEKLAVLYDGISGAIVIGLFLLACIAIIRVIYKKIRGESVHISPVGVNKDLPSSITGISKDDKLK